MLCPDVKRLAEAICCNTERRKKGNEKYLPRGKNKIREVIMRCAYRKINNQAVYIHKQRCGKKEKDYAEPGIAHPCQTPGKIIEPRVFGLADNNWRQHHYYKEKGQCCGRVRTEIEGSPCLEEGMEMQASVKEKENKQEKAHTD